MPEKNPLLLDSADSCWPNSDDSLIPQALLKNPNIDQVQHVRSLRRPRSSRLSIIDKKEFKVFPLIEELENSDGDKLKLFTKKLEQCNLVFDFNVAEANIKSKRAKHETLEELITYLEKYPLPRSDSFYYRIIEMISSNIFRDITPQTSFQPEPFDPEEDEPAADPAWPHLELVYIFFQRFLESSSFDETIARKPIDQKFTSKLLSLFDTEDPREREALKTILHRIYGKILSLRFFIRKSISNLFLQFIYENDRHNGITELLEILGSIINGFTIPLKEEHKFFLRRVLLPLHKTSSMSTYHHQLAYCTVQFIEKDASLAQPTILSLLRFWPKVNSTKEVIFLNEIEEILEIVGLEEFETFYDPLFHQLSKCIVSPHFQVSDRALMFWRNTHVVQLIHSMLESIAPIVLRQVCKSCNSHWNQTIHQHAYSVFRFFMLSDEQLFENCIAQIKQSQAQTLIKDSTRGKKWTLLYNTATSRSSNLELPPILNHEYNKNADTSSNYIDLIIDNIIQEQVSTNSYQPQVTNHIINSFPTPAGSQQLSFYDNFADFQLPTPYSSQNNQVSINGIDSPSSYYDSSNTEWNSKS